jgi:glycine oxidase
MAFNAEAGRTADRRPDVIIIGDGVIGLSAAFELGRSGATCLVIGDRRPGIASTAAAGLLAPSIGNLAEAVRPFFLGSLDLFPGFVERLRAFDPSLAMVEGLIDVSGPETGHDKGGAVRLSPDDVHALEPSIVAPHGAHYYPTNGAIDNVALVNALRLALEAAPGVAVIKDDPATGLDFSAPDAAVVLGSGARWSAPVVVVAAGAWSAQLTGLPRRIPVAPLKGQMLAVASTALNHAVMGSDVYLVPRLTELVIGATVEHAGFDVTTDDPAIERLHAAAAAICSPLSDAPVLRVWAGIRPATPDMLPIVGVDPDEPGLIYACGHSKNGILLAPATAIAVAELAQGRRSTFDLAPFSVARFTNA